MVRHQIFVGTEDDAGAVLGPLAEKADKKAMKKLDNKSQRARTALTVTTQVSR